MVGRQKHSPVRADRFGAVSELGLRPQAERLGGGDVRDLAERDDYPDFRQICERRLQIMRAGRDLFRRRLVGGWKAFDRVQDHRAIEREAVARVAAIVSAREAQF